jgi:K319L-like, PKD domain
MSKRRSTALAVLALAAVAVFGLPASSASAASATTPNACANSVTANFSQIDVTTSGSDGVNFATPGQALTTDVNQSAAIPGAIFVAGYNLGLLQQGVNNIPANVQTKIEGTNTTQGTQTSNTVGGTPPNGSVTVTTTITDPDGTPGTGDETATDASFSVAYNNMNWTAGASGTINYRQESIAVAPPTAANNTLLINALIAGFLNVQFRCAPGTVTPPDPGIITLIDPAGSFDTTAIDAFAPVANAGADQTVSPGDLVTLDGSASTDQDLPNDTLTYQWTQTSGPTVTLSDPTAVMPTFTAPGPAPQDLTFDLTVTDQAGQSSTDSVTVLVRQAVSNISISDASATEGGAETFTVSLDTASTQTITVDFATADGTALAGSDYTSNSGTLTFAPGVTSQTVTVQTIDDAVCEGTETFDVNLSNNTGPSAIADGLGVGTITDNDQCVDKTGQVIVNGPVKAGQTAKTYVFKVTNLGTTTNTVDCATEIAPEATVVVNGVENGDVSCLTASKTIGPGSSARFRLRWTGTTALATGDTVVFSACVREPGDIDTSNDCDSASFGPLS